MVVFSITTAVETSLTDTLLFYLWLLLLNRLMAFHDQWSFLFFLALYSEQSQNSTKFK